MPRKAKPKVYLQPPKQSPRDVVDALVAACQGDIHGVHPCEYCNYCVARQHILFFRERDQARKEVVDD